MAQFTSSAKTIQYFCETTLINKFARAVGDRLERLTQCERYQLAHCLSAYLWAYMMTDEDETALNPPEAYDEHVSLCVNGNVRLCLILLKDEEPDNISAILPAIAEYANNESMQEEEEEEELERRTFDGDFVISGLRPMLDRL